MKHSEAVLVRLTPQLKQNIKRVARDNRRPTVEQIRIAIEQNGASEKIKVAAAG